MTKYYIIGDDGLEYGPVSLDDLRQWKAEGRVNAETRVKAEVGEWTTLGQLPGFESAAAPSEVVSEGKPVVYDADYPVDILGWLGKGFQAFQQHIGACLLAALIFLFLNFVIQVPSIVGSLLGEGAVHTDDAAGVLAMIGLNLVLQLFTMVISALFTSVLYGGFFHFCLQIVRGGAVSALDVLIGFRERLVQLVLLSVVSSVLIGIGIVFCILPGIYLAVSYMFASILVIDQKMNFWEAMETSRKAVTSRWFLMFLFILAGGVVLIAGALFCGVGLLVTLPVWGVAMMYAYETIFRSGTR
jgi:hypothetical protein